MRWKLKYEIKYSVILLERHTGRSGHDGWSCHTRVKVSSLTVTTRPASLATSRPLMQQAWAHTWNSYCGVINIVRTRNLDKCHNSTWWTLIPLSKCFMSLLVIEFHTSARICPSSTLKTLRWPDRYATRTYPLHTAMHVTGDLINGDFIAQLHIHRHTET